MQTAAYRKTALMRMLEKQHPGKGIEEIVADALNERGTVKDAAERLGVSRDALVAWMDTMGIELRPVAVVAAQH